jgi:hypothetical protein
MTLEHAQAAVGSLAQQVRTQLHSHRDAGGTDEEFLEEWVPTFVAQARQTPGPAVLVHMAVAIYSLALETDEIARLTDALTMHGELLAMLPD